MSVIENQMLTTTDTFTDIEVQIDGGEERIGGVVGL